MRSAIDTNVIVALWAGEPVATRMAALLGEARLAGGLVICGPVHAELRAHPRATASFIAKFISDAEIAVDLKLSPEIWQLTGDAYAAYAERKRRSAGGEAKRLLVDFIIGAHALLEADRLLTLDHDRYRTAFPDLKLVGS